MKQALLTPPQLGQILRSARRAKQLSQSEAAARMGLSQSRLSAMELDPKSIMVDQLLALMALYGLELVVQSKDARPSMTPAEW